MGEGYAQNSRLRSINQDGCSAGIRSNTRQLKSTLEQVRVSCRDVANRLTYVVKSPIRTKPLGSRLIVSGFCFKSGHTVFTANKVHHPSETCNNESEVGNRKVRARWPEERWGGLEYFISYMTSANFPVSYLLVIRFSAVIHGFPHVICYFVVIQLLSVVTGYFTQLLVSLQGCLFPPGLSGYQMVIHTLLVIST